MPQYLISIALGPVQDFIATARRCRDLWFGSWLLSELAKSLAQTLTEAYGAEALVFPSFEDPAALEPNSPENVPNKILAVAQGSREEILALIESMEEAMLRRLHELAADSFSQVHQRYLHRENAVRQVDDLPEFYVALVPLEGAEGEPYRQARGRSEQLLSARKNTRNYQEVTWGAYVPKSSLDGVREAVIDEEAYKEAQRRNQNQQDGALWLYNQFGVNPGERLCGVGLLKRKGRRSPQEGADRFFSTSHIAALPLLERMERMAQVSPWDQSVPQQVQSYLDWHHHYGSSMDQVPNQHSLFGSYDGRLLFKERLHECVKEEAVEVAGEELETLLSVLDVPGPIPYYTLLLADGDRMGKAIDAQTSTDKHRQLSQQLSMFAQEARAIVNEQFGGSLIYAGGDDVLGLVPLHRALECAAALRDCFDLYMSEFQWEDEEGQTSSPTLSVGLAVSHHLDPLEDALARVREAEKLAKRTRNALAILVQKRSGGAVQCSGLWGQLEARLMRWVDLHQRNAIPEGVAFELLRLHQELPTEQAPNESATHHPASLGEAERILQRKKAQHGMHWVTESDIALLLAPLEEGLSLEELSNELLVTRLFAQASSQASPMLQQSEEAA